MSAEAEHPQKLDLEIPHGEMPEQETDLEPLSDDPPPTNSSPEGEGAASRGDSENNGGSGEGAGHDDDPKRLSEEEVIARALEIIARRLRAGELTLRQLFNRNEEESGGPEGETGKLHDEEPREKLPEEKRGDVDNPTPESHRSSPLLDEELVRRLQAVHHRYLAEHEDEQGDAEQPSEETEEEEGEEEEPAHMPDHPDAVAEREYHERELAQEEERNRSRRKKRLLFGAVLGALAVGALAYFASRGWHWGWGEPPHHGGGGGTQPPGHGGTGTSPPSGGGSGGRPPVADTITLPPYNRPTGAGTLWHATWLEGQRNGADYSQADLVKLMPHVLDYNGDPNPYDVPIGYDAQFPSAQVMNQWLHS